MRILSIVLTFFLSVQLVYASSTVCSNFAKCLEMSSSQVEEMADCPYHPSSKKEDKTENKKEENTNSHCKCCAIITFEPAIDSKPTIVSQISFINFQFTSSEVIKLSSVFLRPPIS